MQEQKTSGWKTVAGLIRLGKPMMPILGMTVVLGTAGFLSVSALMVLGAAGLLAAAGEPVPLSLTAVLWLLPLTAVLRGLLRYAEQLSGHYVAFKLLAFLRNKIFAALRRQPYGKLNSKSAGQLVNTMTGDVELIEVFYAHTIAPVLIAVLTGAVLVWLFALVHPLLAVIALAAYLAVGFVFPYWSAGGKRRLSGIYRGRMGELAGFFIDSMRGMREVVLFNQQQKRLDDLEEKSRLADESFRRVKTHEGSIRLWTDVLIGGFNLLMLLAAAWLCQSGSISFSGALTAVILLVSSYGPFLALSNLAASLPNTLASAERVLALLDESPQMQDVTDGEDLADAGGLAVENASYQYEDGKPVLENVSLAVKRGEILGILGKSGSGKSTLLQLMMRFFDPQSGSIAIGGQDLRRVNTDSLRQNTAYITQQTYLFKQSIYENIVMARRGATPEEVHRAAREANIHELIESLPEGYDTVVSEQGTNLSDGEKQRIGLARAFLHDAPVLLLDEPTSNVDSLNEALILQALQAKRQGKIIVLVSHRLSTLSICDRVFRLESGRLS